MKCKVICLAAGEGMRMKSSLPKVLHRICGKSMIEWSLDASRVADPRPVVVVGHAREQIIEALADKNVDFAVQAEQLGTGHAVIIAREYIEQQYTHVLITMGDMSMLEREDIESLMQAGESADAVVATAVVEDPTGYGHVISHGGHVSAIVEHKDASEEQRRICEINLAIYIFRREALLEALENIGNNNAQHEYYLPDCVGYIASKGGKVNSLVMDAVKGMGVNDRVQLAEANRERGRLIKRALMLSGVTIIDPDNTYIEAGASIGHDSVIYPGAAILNAARIGQGCVIGPCAKVECEVPDNGRYGI